MEPKKNPKSDLNRRSMIFFQLGMILMLFITWRAIENKTYEKAEINQDMLNLGDDLDEDIPITDMNIPPPPPPPPPPAPEVIEVIEDEADIEETIIESAEVNQEEEIMEIDEIEEALKKKLLTFHLRLLKMYLFILDVRKRDPMLKKRSVCLKKFKNLFRRNSIQNLQAI